MNILQKIVSSIWRGKAAPIIPGGRFIEVGGQLTWMQDDVNSYIVNGYQANDIIYSIVNMIMEKVKVAPWGLYKVVDEQKLKQYQSFLDKKDYAEAKLARRKALEPIVNFNRQTGRLNDLLKWPNSEDTFSELVAAGSGYINITGNNYLWADLLKNGANEGLPSELWNVPAQHMSIRATREFPQKKTGYQLNIGPITSFSVEEIMHEKLFNPSYGASGDGLYGMAPIKAAIKTTTRNNASKKAGATQLENNGAAGIAYLDDPVVTASGRSEQIDAVKRVWAKEYTGKENYGKIAFSGYKMGYTSVGLSLKEMALSELELVDMRILANVWGLPSQLLNDPQNKSYNNAKEAEKALTSRCALPRLVSRRDNLNRKLQTDWGFKGVNVFADFDMSVYTELQEDQKEKWEWVKQLPVSSRYKLEMMGLDVPNDPNMDVILVDGNLIPIGDVINSMDDDQMNRVNEELNKAGIADYLRIAK